MTVLVALFYGRRLQCEWEVILCNATLLWIVPAFFLNIFTFTSNAILERQIP